MQWQPGQSGNPGGRPARKAITDALKAEIDKLDRGDTTKAQKIAARLVRLALAGKAADSIQAAKLILAYTEGLPVQPIDLEIRKAAERVAAQTGADPDWLIKRAREIAAASVP